MRLIIIADDVLSTCDPIVYVWGSIQFFICPFFIVFILLLFFLFFFFIICLFVWANDMISPHFYQELVPFWVSICQFLIVFPPQKFVRTALV